MPKTQKCAKVYIGTTDDAETKSGKQEKRSYFDGATHLELRFVSGETVKVNPDEFSDTVKVAALFHGLSQKLGDTYAGADADEAYDKTMALFERLQGGEWIAERESAGPRISTVVEAIVAAKAKAGVTVTIDEVAAKYKALDKDAQKDVLNDPRIKAEYEAIKARRAQERADKAAAKAAEGEGEFAI